MCYLIQKLDVSWFDALIISEHYTLPFEIPVCNSSLS